MNKSTVESLYKEYKERYNNVLKELEFNKSKIEYHKTIAEELSEKSKSLKKMLEYFKKF